MSDKKKKVSRKKIAFYNQQNIKLSGVLEIPEDDCKAYAVFAHCFAGSKDLIAPKYISASLSNHGVAVLRFDFTGLGNSGGDFSQTTFSSNIGDLVAACNYLKENYQAPGMIIGHSLGGAATLASVSNLENIKAVATIGSPRDAVHVSKLFEHKKDEIKEKGFAHVDIAGKSITITKEFLDDLSLYNSEDYVPKLGCPILVMHSPIDEVVNIDEAAKLFKIAMHPKSFISLGNADHLLTKKEDAQFVADIIAAFAEHYL